MGFLDFCGEFGYQRCSEKPVILSTFRIANQIHRQDKLDHLIFRRENSLSVFPLLYSWLIVRGTMLLAVSFKLLLLKLDLNQVQILLGFHDKQADSVVQLFLLELD
jgi:hypothetical protein